MRSSRVRKIHRHAQRIHFCRRSEERLGYVIGVEEVIRIRKDIREGTAELLYEPNARLSMWRVPIHIGTAVVVYDNVTEELVTVITEAMWAQRMRGRERE